MNTKEIYKRATRKWGMEPQLRQTQEECAELISAINRFTRRKESSFTHMMEEIADVEIMIGQIKHSYILYTQKFEYNGIKRKKLNRLAKLLIKEN